MTGYFRFYKQLSTYRTTYVYRRYYCGTCFALDHQYGQLSRFFLSFDTVILGLIARILDNPLDELRLPCFFQERKKTKYKLDERWKKLAAINVLLIAGELKDDINDENSERSRLLGKFFSRQFSKAEKSYPELSEIIQDGYKRMLELEKEGRGVVEICDEFADFMVHLMVVAFSINDCMKSYLYYISRWLYFIDQLDDYDKDVKKNVFNPLVKKGISKLCYVSEYHEELQDILHEITTNYNDIKGMLVKEGTIESEILYSILSNSIPKVTESVLNDTWRR